MNKLTLKNYFFLTDNETRVESILNFLYKQTLHGLQSRMRTKFINELKWKHDEVANRRKELLTKYSDKDKETGKTIFLDQEGKDTLDEKEAAKYKVSDENNKKYIEDVAKYLDQEFDVDTDDVQMISSVNQILSESKTPMFGKMADVYDEWCQAFENVFAQKPDSGKKKSKK